MKINAVELERMIDNGIENSDILVTELFEFIESVIYSIETNNSDEVKSLVEQWRSDEIIDPEIDEDLDELDLEDDDIEDFDLEDDD